MNPQPNAASMLPPQAVASMIRNGGTPGMLFPQDPLSQGQTPGAAGYDPGLAQQPPIGSQQIQPQQGMPPVAPNGQPGGQQGQEIQPSEAQMILNALADRLNHHSKITEKTIATLDKMIDANISVQSNSPEANALNYQIGHGA